MSSWIPSCSPSASDVDEEDGRGALDEEAELAIAEVEAGSEAEADSKAEPEAEVEVEPDSDADTLADTDETDSIEVLTEGNVPADAAEVELDASGSAA